MPQAYAQQRNFPGKLLNERDADSRLLGTARPRRNYDAFGLELLDLIEGDLIVSATDARRRHFRFVAAWRCGLPRVPLAARFSWSAVCSAVTTALALLT